MRNKKTYKVHPEPKTICSHVQAWAVSVNNSVVELPVADEDVRLEFVLTGGQNIVIYMNEEVARDIACQLGNASELAQFGWAGGCDYHA